MRKQDDNYFKSLDGKKFVSLLKNELEERCGRNANYSLRSFSGLLGIDASSLSKILNHKRSLSPTNKIKISHALMLSPEKLASFEKVKATPLKTTQYNIIDEKLSVVISKWYYYAILELTTLHDFQSNYKWIAGQLDLSPHQVISAIEKLLAIGYLKQNEAGDFYDTSGEITTVNEGNSFASLYYQRIKQKLQIQILTKAIDAVEKISLDKRSQSSLTVAINNEDIAFIKEEITLFRRKLASQINFRNKNKKRENVYNISFSFYPLTEDREENHL